MKRLRFVLLGGFLGAGKTTALARLARHYAAQGRRVGLVTNDQADDLVDTNSLRAQGFPVQEVAGACFCCKFDDLVGKIGALQDSDRPDVILAEPVGSCTDLVATVVQPLRDLYGDRFEVAPYAVFFKPSHGTRILRGEPAGGFSPKAAYVFTKQLEEADAIVLNRLDEMTPEAARETAELVASKYPGTPVLALSARTGQGFDALASLLDQTGDFGRKILSIDYDVYAEGEAELGWFNGTARVKGGFGAFDVDALLLSVLTRLRAALGPDAEVAHLKAIGLCDGGFGVANLVSSASRPELSLPSRRQADEAELIVNARVAADPDLIEQRAREATALACAEQGAEAAFVGARSFRPGRPTPTHRYAEAK